jgi:hypothetical protein
VVVSGGRDGLRPTTGGAPASDRPWFFEGVVHDYDTADDLVHGLSFGAIGLADALALLETDIPTTTRADAM